MISISIVIVTYNSGNEISECISSIISTLSDLEFQIIIVDNHSIDNTLSIIQEFDDPNISLIKNKFQSIPHNKPI